jgi:uncharacterized protein (TIGR02594 family)
LVISEITIFGMSDSSRLGPAERIAVVAVLAGIAGAVVAVALPLAFPDWPRIAWQIIAITSALMLIGSLGFLAYDIVLRQRLWVWLSVLRARAYYMLVMVIVLIMGFGIGWNVNLRHPKPIQAMGGPLEAIPPKFQPILWYSFASIEHGTNPEQNFTRIIEYISRVQSARGLTPPQLPDWSSAFVEWSLNKAGVGGPKDPNPFAWREWGRSIEQPEPGCVIILEIGRDRLKHVGFYVGNDNGGPIVLAGSQRGALSQRAVSFRTYSAKDSLGCRLPG